MQNNAAGRKTQPRHLHQMRRARWLLPPLVTTAPVSGTNVQEGVWQRQAITWRRSTQRWLSDARATSSQRIESAVQLFFSALPTQESGASTATTTAPVAANAQTPRATVIANPTSGTLRNGNAMRELERSVAWLTEHGLPTELRLTEYADHAPVLAREAVEAGREIVIAAGGDGTVNAVIQALAGHTTALGVLPLGTVNVWAREVGISFDMAEACEVVLKGVKRRMDLGRAGSRYFLLMAGIGLDAEVARRVDKSWLKRIGLKLLDYLATAGMLGVTGQPVHVSMRRNGKRRGMKALMVIIGNTRLYGGALTFAANAVADDGLLDVVTVSGHTLRSRGIVLLRAILRRPAPGPHVRYERTRSIRIESNPPLPVQVDGELIGTLPMTFSVAPLALSVIVPANTPADLFVHAPERR